MEYPAPAGTIAICVPVKNEEAGLPPLLRALAAMRVPAGERPVLCMFLDGCTDASERVLRAAMPTLAIPVTIGSRPPGAGGNVGQARRAAMAMGLAAVGAAPGALLLTTDADSAPAPAWIDAATRALGDVEIVAGAIVRAGVADSPLQSRLEAYYDRLYALRRRIDPVAWEPIAGRHFVSGANLGFRAADYDRLGGFPPIALGEDATLIDDAGRAGLRVRRERAMVVETSARRIGRAAGGMACWLGQLDRDGDVRVAHPGSMAWQYRAHAAARRAFARIDDAATRAAFGGAIGLTADHVLGVARDCPNGEAFAMRIVPAPPPAAQVSLGEAEVALAAIADATDLRAA